eukprot:Clim_evm78s210 gene=Clim_evmTU78s210
MTESVEGLRARVRELETELARLIKKDRPSRQKIAHMDDAVRADNPYSRLLALQRMGVVENYRMIRDCTVLLVGVGGVGAVAAEMLTRSGIGKLILYDYDSVELANMNRMFYTPQQCGMSKVDAAIETLSMINPDTELVGRHCNVTSVRSQETLEEDILRGSLDGSKIQLLLSCVDTYEARVTLNHLATTHCIEWIESGVGENAVSSHVQFMEPGLSACYMCIPPLLVSLEEDEKQLNKEGVCAASLSTVVSITAGLLVQAALKYLLHFGEVSAVINYNALADYFAVFPKAPPNPECECDPCRLQQVERMGDISKHQKHLQAPRSTQDEDLRKAKEDKSSEDWSKYGIEIVDDSNEDEDHDTISAAPAVDIGDSNLSDLRSQLSQLQK